MIYDQNCTVFLLILNLVCHIESAVVKLQDVGDKNVRNGGIMIHSITGIGFIMCARGCEKIEQCVGFNFNPTILHCELLKTKSSANISGNGWWYCDNVAWLKDERLSTGTAEEVCGTESLRMKIKLRDNSVHCARAKMPIDCSDSLITSFATENGVYQISPKKNLVLDVYCDFKTDGGGWTVLQSRISDTVNFHVQWSMYKDGFGDLFGNFWLGKNPHSQISVAEFCANSNDKIHALVSTYSYRLRVDLEDWEGTTVYAVYNTFQVDGIAQKYRLTVGEYSGNAGDSLTSHNGMKFSTYDLDNDLSSMNCASTYKGGWWFKWCYDCNLNGGYYPQSTVLTDTVGIHWFSFHAGRYSLKSVSMKVTRK